MEQNIDLTVKKIVANVLLLKPEQVKLEDSFLEDYNCSSIDFLRILSEIENKLNVSLIKRSKALPVPTTEEINEFRIRNLIQTVKESMTATN